MTNILKRRSTLIWQKLVDLYEALNMAAVETAILLLLLQNLNQKMKTNYDVFIRF